MVPLNPWLKSLLNHDFIPYVQWSENVIWICPKCPMFRPKQKKHIITWPLAAGLAWNLPNLLRKLGAPIFMAEGKHFVFRITSPQAFSCDAWSTTTGKILIKDSDATVAPSLVCETPILCTRGRLQYPSWFLSPG